MIKIAHQHIVNGKAQTSRTPSCTGDFELLESMFASEMLSVPTVRHLLETKQLIPAFLAAVLLEHLHRVGKRK